MPIVTCPHCGAKNRVDETAAAQRQPVCGRCGTPLGAAPQSTGKSSRVPIEITDGNFQSDVMDVRGKPVLVDCWASWCPPCRMLAPTIDALAAESDGRFVVGKLDVDQNQRIAGQYRIESIPTMLIFRDGKLVDRLVGLQSKQAIADRLQQAAR